MYSYPLLTVFLAMIYLNLTELSSNVFSSVILLKEKYDNFHLVTIKAVFLEPSHLEWPSVNDYMWKFHWL